MSMKKLLAFVLSFLLIFSFYSCGNSEPWQNFEFTFSRAGGSGDPNIYDGALNQGKLHSNDAIHLPIYKFDTLADLEKFKSDFGGKSGFNYGWDEVPSFNSVTEKYDDAFFEENSLLLIYIVTGSGSERFGFKGIYLEDNYLCVHTEQTNNPQGGTEDVAAWFITVTVSDSLTKNCTEFDAIFNPSRS